MKYLHVSIGSTLDEKLRGIESQIAVNLQQVHNHFCEQQLASPSDVYAYLRYGQTEDRRNQEILKPFIDFDFRFVEIGHSFDEPGYPKEKVLEEYQELERQLQEAMSAI